MTTPPMIDGYAVQFLARSVKGCAPCDGHYLLLEQYGVGTTTHRLIRACPEHKVVWCLRMTKDWAALEPDWLSYAIAKAEDEQDKTQKADQDG